MFINTKTGEWPLTAQQVMDHANQIGAFSLPGGFAEVAIAPQPTVSHTQTVEADKPQEVNGAWTQDWKVVDLPADQVVAVIAAQWDNVRADRDNRLAASDWTQLADAPLDGPTIEAWAAYRQALRDITDQPDPFAPVWPDAPGGVG